MRWLPDWAIYALAIIAIFLVTLTLDMRRRNEAPPAFEGSETLGPLLPPPSVFDPEILVDVGPVTSGLGTAFAISTDGWWLTARHVVDDCQRVGQVGLVVAQETAAEVDVAVAQFADLALLHTKGAPTAIALDDTEDDLRIGQTAYHVGFPQGRRGEAASRLLRRETLVTRGRYTIQQPVLVWVETGRTRGLNGTLSGISGGPALDSNGQAIGVTLAESSRRGRIYTASPATIFRLLEVERVAPSGEPVERITDSNYGGRADELRRSLAVAQVICIVERPDADPQS
ncbi:MAG: trypsin-like serine protease [Alphaproteobacteria bacterium]|nr:trypsin-like serine protease [Alphaproteobacteria bacterium]